MSRFFIKSLLSIVGTERKSKIDFPMTPEDRIDISDYAMTKFIQAPPKYTKITYFQSLLINHNCPQNIKFNQNSGQKMVISAMSH